MQDRPLIFARDKRSALSDIRLLVQRLPASQPLKGLHVNGGLFLMFLVYRSIQCCAGLTVQAQLCLRQIYLSIFEGFYELGSQSCALWKHARPTLFLASEVLYLHKSFFSPYV